MKDVMFNTSGVCASKIFFQLDEEGKIHNLQFNGGCNGNLKDIGLFFISRRKRRFFIAYIMNKGTVSFGPLLSR